MLLKAGRISRALVGASVLASKSSTVAWTTTAPPLFRLIIGSSSSLLVASVAMTSSTDASSSCSFTVVQIPCLSDNYGYLLHHDATGHTAAIDTPEAAPYREELKKRGWKLTHIFNTHHHWDHTGGNMDLKTDGVKIYGPASEKIPGMDFALKAGDDVEFGSTKAKIMDVGGHTKGHIAYYFSEDAKVFVGDSLFALGCGRMFEGTPEQFWTSLMGLRKLPDETEVYWYDKSMLVKFTSVIVFP